MVVMSLGVLYDLNVCDTIRNIIIQFLGVKKKDKEIIPKFELTIT